MPRPMYLPADTLTGCSDKLGDTSLLDFWKWAFSDLCDDDLKGIFAEWIVLKLLGISSDRRISWANSDILNAGKTKIEIKASSYWQSWKLLDGTGALRPTPLCPVSSDKQIRFKGLKARNSDGFSTKGDKEDFKSDIYIFAFQREKDIERWSVMDLSQWEFYALPVSNLRTLGWKSISLPALRAEQKKLCGQETLTAESFPEFAKELIEAAEKTKSLP